MHMMGKRVNYACRSVITPDPYLDVDEVGIPVLFARRLTFKEPVFPLNQERLGKAIARGPNIHPGANYVESLTRPGLRQLVGEDLTTRRQQWERMRMEKLQSDLQHKGPEREKPKNYVGSWKFIFLYWKISAS